MELDQSTVSPLAYFTNTPNHPHHCVWDAPELRSTHQIKLIVAKDDDGSIENNFVLDRGLAIC
ncbi:hypothetical protein PILCRDRAFT_830011, partial [Piloderma croceum F 1598]